MWFSTFLLLVLVSILFLLLCVLMIFISVSAAEWPPFGKELLIRSIVCFVFAMSTRSFGCFTFLFRRQDLGSDCMYLVSGHCLPFTLCN